MASIPHSLLGASALSLMEYRTRREWKSALQTLRLIDVGWQDLVHVQPADAWKWLGWDAARIREWQGALDIARTRLAPAAAQGIQVISELDENPPAWLIRLESVPWVFYRGNPAVLDQTTLGFSGQREAGEQALAITSSLCMEAARIGFCVVSGGARGIDMAAHTAVLDAGGSTAVILPQGISTWNPPFALARQSAAERVLVLGEDVPWEGWTTESAMRRNRMIVELSDVFTVPQSGTSGGSHSTGKYALSHSKVTFVPDLGDQYPGNRVLLQRGARPLNLIDGKADLQQMLIDSTPIPGPEQTSLF